jgi:hypothetical protein
MPPAEIVNEHLDTLLTNRLLAMIEETLLTTNDIGVTYETYAAALIPILVGAARALNHVTNADRDLVASVAQSMERGQKVGPSSENDSLARGEQLSRIT